MRFLLPRWLLVLVVLIVGAASCSSSSEGTGVATDAPTDVANEPSDGDETQSAGSAEIPETEPVEVPGTAEPVPEDDPAAAAAIAALDGEEPPEIANADPATTAIGFVRSRFNIDPEPEWANCMVGEMPDNEVLDLALRTPSVADGEVDDAEMKALAFAMNGCLDTAGLADWATQAVGPQGEVRETAPACFAERFDDPDRGDVTFYTFVALTYQFRVEAEGVPDVIDALVTCTPITALSDFFANQAEAESAYDTVIDRECLVDRLSDPAASERFWVTLIEGLVPPVSTVAEDLANCAEVVDADLAATVGADFVPWSGTGALAGVKAAARANVYAAPPPMTIDGAVNYEAVLVTGGGEIRIRLFAGTAPVTVNNFVNLARDGYFDSTVFHRVMAGFMAQGGDPTGSGAGGPGYSFEDEFDGGPPLDRAGLLAMANTGPNTIGSQFFITVAPADWLTGAHTVFGEVVSGQEIVDAIELRDPLAPNGRGQALESVTIVEN